MIKVKHKERPIFSVCELYHFVLILMQKIPNSFIESKYIWYSIGYAKKHTLPFSPRNLLLNQRK